MQIVLEQKQMSALTMSYLRIPSYDPTIQEEAYSPSEKDKGRNLRIVRGNELARLESEFEETNSPSPIRLRLQMKSLQQPEESALSDYAFTERKLMTH